MQALIASTMVFMVAGSSPATTMKLFTFPSVDSMCRQAGGTSDKTIHACAFQVNSECDVFIAYDFPLTKKQELFDIVEKACHFGTQI